MVWFFTYSEYIYFIYTPPQYYFRRIIECVASHFFLLDESMASSWKGGIMMCLLPPLDSGTKKVWCIQMFRASVGFHWHYHYEKTTKETERKKAMIPIIYSWRIQFSIPSRNFFNLFISIVENIIIINLVVYKTCKYSSSSSSMQYKNYVFYT